MDLSNYVKKSDTGPLELQYGGPVTISGGFGSVSITEDGIALESTVGLNLTLNGQLILTQDDLIGSQVNVLAILSQRVEEIWDKINELHPESPGEPGGTFVGDMSTSGKSLPFEYEGIAGNIYRSSSQFMLQVKSATGKAEPYTLTGTVTFRDGSTEPVSRSGSLANNAVSVVSTWTPENFDKWEGVFALTDVSYTVTVTTNEDYTVTTMVIDEQ